MSMLSLLKVKKKENFHFLSNSQPITVIIVLSEVKVAQSCLTLCYYILHGILQSRIMEWVAFPFSRRSSQPRNQTQVSCTAGRLFTS